MLLPSRRIELFEADFDLPDQGYKPLAPAIPDFGLRGVEVLYAPMGGDHRLGIKSGMALKGTLIAFGKPLLDVDAYVTSDLRHHPALEFLEKDGPALLDVPHWAAEWTWLPVVRASVQEALGDTVDTRVSTLVTDPWDFRRP